MKTRTQKLFSVFLTLAMLLAVALAVNPVSATGDSAAVVDFSNGAQDFDLYSTGSGGFQVVDGKLTPTGASGEFKAIYNGTDAAISSVSVEIHPVGTDGYTNTGLYINASNPANGQDKIDALFVGVESNFSGWTDAPNRIDIVQGVFEQKWVSLVGDRFVSEAINSPVYSGGKKEPIKLRVDIAGNVLTITVSLVSNPARFATTTYTGPEGTDYSLGKVGIRSHYDNACFDNFAVNAPEVSAENALAQVAGQNFASVQTAVNAAGGGLVKLLRSSEEAITVSRDITLDLAGNSLSNVTVADGAVLTLIDTATDDYAGACGSAVITGEVTTLDGYLLVKEGGTYSAHAYQVELTHISLDPGNDALGYKAKLFGDAVVQEKATAVGFHMWVDGGQVKTYTTDAKEVFTLRLKNILKNHGGEMNIHATAFVTFDGITKISQQQTTTMRKTLQLVNEAWYGYTQSQRQAVKTLCDQYLGTVSAWGLNNIYSDFEVITGSCSVNHISGYTADGKLSAPNSGEGKVILENTPTGNKVVSVELHPGADGINGGIYLGASGAGSDRDAIQAVYVGIEANFSGWDDAVNRVDLIIGQFPWTEYTRVISETGRSNALFAGSREPVKLEVEVNGNTVTATVSPLSDPSKSISASYTYAGSCDLANGQVGLRSQFNNCSFDNFKVNDITYTFDDEASTEGLRFYHSVSTNGVYTKADNTLVLYTADTFTEGTLAATMNTAGKNAGGIVFGADEAGKNYHLLRITNNQWVELVKVENGVETVLDKGYLSAGHNYNQPNRLEIVKDGDTVYCYYYNRFDKINCYAVQNVTLAGDGVGLWAAAAGTSFGEFTFTEDKQIRKADTLIFGHSYTEMWTDYETYFPEYPSIDDIGIGGSVAVHWEALADEIITYAPKLGIYNIGINDLTGSTPPQAIIESMETALLEVKEALPEFEVVLVSVSHCPARNTITNTISQTNALMRNLAASYDWMYYAEAEYLFCSDPADPLSTIESMFIDGLHPSAEGYQLLAAAIKSAAKGENQPEFDDELDQEEFAQLKSAKLDTLNVFGQNAYGQENWENAKPYYDEAVSKINACTSLAQLKTLDLSAEITALRGISGKAETLVANLLDVYTRDSLSATGWTAANANTVTVSGYSYALDNTAVYGDCEFIFKLSNNTGTVGTGGIFLRAKSLANKGIQGYLINYVTGGEYLQVYYVDNCYNTDGTSYTLQYIGGIAYGAYGQLSGTEFYAKVAGDTLLINTWERQIDGQSPLVQVDLTYGGKYDVFESGYTGVLSWNNGVSFDMQLGSISAQAKAAAEETEDDVLKVLAIGNSFSIDGMEYVYQIAQDLGVEKIKLGNLYIGGCTLQTHYNNLLSDSAAYTYYVNEDGNWVTKGASSLQFALKSDNWDVITFQQASGFSGVADSYDTLVDLIAGVKHMRPNARFGWHMTWAYQGDSTHADFAKYNNDQATMYQAIVNAVQSKILTNGDIDFVIPAGTAIQNARTSYLGDSLTRDGYHLSYTMGRYIAGLTWAQATTGQDVSGLTYCPAGINEDMMHLAIESAQNAAAAPYAVTASEHTLENSFIQLDLNLTSGWYNSTNTGTDPYMLYASTSSLPFYATKVFTKAELPVGTIIVNEAGYYYRPEGWVNGQGVARPGQINTKMVVIDEAWWGDWTERGFNVNVGSLDVSAETAEAGFKIYLPKSAYEKVELNVIKAFYNSQLYPATQTQAASTSLKFFTVQTFTKQTLPVGSIILNTEGRNIRLERWMDGTVKNSDGMRGSLSTAKQHVVDASWWDGFDTRAFNIPVSSLDDSQIDALLAAFAIYVPKTDTAQETDAISG